MKPRYLTEDEKCAVEARTQELYAKAEAAFDNTPRSEEHVERLRYYQYLMKRAQTNFAGARRRLALEPQAGNGLGAARPRPPSIQKERIRAMKKGSKSYGYGKSGSKDSGGSASCTAPSPTPNGSTSRKSVGKGPYAPK